MIDQITIKNVGGVASASLRLEKGLTVITGESGSGKSSLVRALEILGGKRGQTAFIRSGEEEALVEAIFSGIEGQKKDIAVIPENDEDPFLFARRILTRNGRNRTFFQDRAVPLSTFASVMNERIRIQSQFAQIELLNPKRQMEILDFCGGEKTHDLLKNLSKVFTEAVECEREFRKEKAREQELKNRFKEGDTILSAVKGLKLTPECDHLWEKDLERVSLRIEKLQKIRGNLLHFTGCASEPGLLDRLESCGLDLLHDLGDEGKSLENIFNEGLNSLQHFVREATQKEEVPSIKKLETERDSLEKKVGLLRKLKRAVGVFSVEEFMAWCKEAREASGWLREAAARSGILAEKGKSLRKEAHNLAMELRSQRLRSAASLEEKVNKHLSELAMEDSCFSVRLLELDKIRNSGADEILFTLSEGGREETPVNKTASGGELSRILLALQLSLPEHTLPSTLIFDEVEAGLGGRAAVLAGYKLLDLSRKCQVVLVTHEATIAALAQHHFRVKKQGESLKAVKLSYDERVEEIARMLSGDASLSEARDHARKLLAVRQEPPERLISSSI